MDKQIIRQNQWEGLFDGFMDLTEFSLVKYEDGWGLVDNQGGNLGDIESDRFKSAGDIFERMEHYIDDYIIRALEDIWVNEAGFDVESTPSLYADWLKHRETRGFEDSGFDLDLLDMIANHYNDINLENCTYENKQ